MPGDKARVLSTFSGESRSIDSPLRQVYGVLWANLKMLFTYKTWVITDFMSSGASIVMYYLMGLQVDTSQLIRRGYGADYGAFALVGVATSSYLWNCLVRLSHRLSHEIEEGTFETIVSTRVRIWAYFVGQTLRGYVVSILGLLGMVGVGVYGLGIALSSNPASLLTALALFILMVVANQAIGFMAAGVIMVHKRGDPVTFILAMLNEFFAGVLYPLDLLSQYPVFSAASRALPYTYALDGLRRALIQGATIAQGEVLMDLLALAVFSVVLVPIGIYILNWGYNTVRKRGTTSSF